jgi:hypothetical protein
MSSTIDTSAFDRATDPILGILSPTQAAEIVNYHADETLQERIETLAHLANEGELTDAERAEYEGYIQANQFVAVLQAQVRRRITPRNDS